MSGKPSSAARTLITVLMDILVLVAVIGLAHLVVSFFGQLSHTGWGSGLLQLTRYAVLPLGLGPIETPYGGVFDVNAAATIVALLGVEWLLGAVRRTA